MEKLVEKTMEYVKSRQLGEGSGHDWWHTLRVYKLAVHIAEKENGNILVISLASLLHDIADYKLNNGDTEIGPKTARLWLEQNNVPNDIIVKVTDIIATMSFKGANVDSSMKTLEGKIVQDADRLDAIGSIGIARTFAYGGHANREIYNPHQDIEVHSTFEEYKNNKSCTINHFYEKLLLLKDLMNTPTAKEIAEERHQYMLDFLDRFHKEWDGLL